MAKSDFTYKIFSDERVISIVDLDKGNMSVTNNIENVVKEIADEANVRISHFKIIYRDSSGIWDGYDPRNDKFIPLDEKHEMDALIAIQKPR